MRLGVMHGQAIIDVSHAHADAYADESAKSHADARA
jgi:hypothetical protein